MPIVDAQGRLFGRVNLLDAVIGIVLVGLIPLVYGAYAMFRTPPPRLITVEPASVVNGADAPRVMIRGENLRPYMRVSFNNIQGDSFAFLNTEQALVGLDPMPPGVYDVVLYDNAQERARLPKAFTLLPAPLPVSQVTLIGTLGNLTVERADQVKAGMAMKEIGEIVNVGTPLPETTRVFAGAVLEIPIEKAVRLPVEIRAGCSVRAPEGVPECVIGNVPVQPTTLILVHTPLGPLPFQVDQIRGTQPLEPIRLAVQFTLRRELMKVMQRGDADFGQYMNPLAAGATVISIGSPLVVGPDLVRVDLAIDARAQRGSSSWTYAATPLRAGATVMLRTPKYQLEGLVLSIEPAWAPASSVGLPAQNGAGK